MTILDKLTDKFAEFKVTEEELPDKTKRKLTQLRSTLQSKLPNLRDKTTGEYTEKTKTKIRDLVTDIIAEAKAFAEARDSATPPVPGDPSNPGDPGDPDKNKSKPKKKEGFFDWLWG